MERHRPLCGLNGIPFDNLKIAAKMRLHAYSPEHVEEAHRTGFISTTLVARWRQYLLAANNITPAYHLQDRLVSNLTHRLQLLEFETALLLHYRDHAPQRQTLFQPVLSLKIHQHIVLCHAILEGMGSHFMRAADSAAGRPVVLERRFRPDQWHPAIITAAFPAYKANETVALTSELEDLKSWRDRIHMDTVNPGAALDILTFTVDGRFEPAYRLFRKVMTAINTDWPDGTCLNEEV